MLDLEDICSHVHEGTIPRSKVGLQEANIEPWRKLIFGMRRQNSFEGDREVWKEEHRESKLSRSTRDWRAKQTILPHVREDRIGMTNQFLKTRYLN